MYYLGPVSDLHLCPSKKSGSNKNLGLHLKCRNYWESVANIHNFGRTVAASARRPKSFSVLVDMCLIIITLNLHGNKESYAILQKSTIL